MKKAKYLVCPGAVFSKNDGQEHFISAEQLIRLYKVNPKDCRIFSDDGLSHYGFIRQAKQEGRDETYEECAKIAENCTIDWGILEHEDKCRFQIVNAIRDRAKMCKKTT